MALHELGGAALWTRTPPQDPAEPFLYLRLMGEGQLENPNYRVELAVGRSLSDIHPTDAPSAATRYGTRYVSVVGASRRATTAYVELNPVGTGWRKEKYSQGVLDATALMLQELGYKWDPELTWLHERYTTPVANETVRLRLPGIDYRTTLPRLVAAGVRLARDEAARLHDLAERPTTETAQAPVGSEKSAYDIVTALINGAN